MYGSPPHYDPLTLALSDYTNARQLCEAAWLHLRAEVQALPDLVSQAAVQVLEHFPLQELEVLMIRMAEHEAKLKRSYKATDDYILELKAIMDAYADFDLLEVKMTDIPPI